MTATLSWLRWDGEDLMVTLKVQPRASRERWMGIREGILQVALTAPPVEGAANEALPRFLAKELNVATGRIRIVQGERSRNKVVRIVRPDRAVVRAWAERVDPPNH
ncbi:MAG: YggU family protein [Magnetococcales bacterium]|nr:YggU family protein [Magnetococcales bacterium]